MCTVLLSPFVNPTAVNKYIPYHIISYHISYHIICLHNTLVQNHATFKITHTKLNAALIMTKIVAVLEVKEKWASFTLLTY